MEMQDQPDQWETEVWMVMLEIMDHKDLKAQLDQKDPKDQLVQ